MLRSASRVLVLLLTLLLVASVGASAQSLDEARRERAAVQQRLDQATTRLGQLEDRVARLEDEVRDLEAQRAALEAEFDELADLITFRVREVFKHGSTLDPVAVFLSSEDPETALGRASAVARLVGGDRAESEALAASRVALRSVVERLEAQQTELDAALEEQQAQTRQLTQDLERARQLEQRLEREDAERRRREEAARRARQRQSTAGSGGGSARVAPGGKACPVDQPRSFTDTWGAPRSGGRSHRGTDILAPYGTPVRAIVSGTWSIQRPGPSAGLWAILRGSDGNQYWYMHLQSHTVANGARVSAGQQVGTNGDTGNARGTPHVHFELHPGGGSAVNPYPLLKAVCG